MTRGAPFDPTPPSVAILGADAVLAALPATPVQLAHACHALGFEMVFPASWGDELVAAGCLRELAARASGPAVLCTCPFVRDRLTRTGLELAPWLVSLVAPPVAAARYVRAAFGARGVHITFIGACPSGDDPAIDVHATPAALFAALAEQGIVPTAQPELFDSLLPPDRRRYYSLPGGVPSPERLAADGGARALVVLEGEDVAIELAQRLLARESALIDVAPALGCACSGVLVPGGAHGARPALVALEPPRAKAPVLDPAVRIDVDRPLPREAPAAASMPAAAIERAALASGESATAVGAAEALQRATHEAGRPVPPPPPVTPPWQRVAGAPTPASAPGARQPPSRTTPAPTPRAPVPRAPQVAPPPPTVTPRRVTPVRLRAYGAPPSSRDQEGAVVPRAYLGQRRHVRPPGTARRTPARSTTARRGRADREAPIDRTDEPASPPTRRRATKTPRGSPPTNPEPPPVPPPPARHRARPLLGIGLAALALAVGSGAARQAPPAAAPLPTAAVVPIVG